ncbi:MAG: SpoIID/LytB domain-containing protein [Oscillospiraceae bacterium]|nr:SpoIID/LytB domain-containing protein [Oscillospiraceae bacterium]
MLKPEITIKISLTLAIILFYSFVLVAIKPAGVTNGYFADDDMPRRNNADSDDDDYIDDEPIINQPKKIFVQPFYAYAAEDYLAQSTAGNYAQLPDRGEILLSKENSIRKSEQAAQTDAVPTQTSISPETTLLNTSVSEFTTVVPITGAPTAIVTNPYVSPVTTSSSGNDTTAAPITAPPDSDIPQPHTDVPDITVKNSSGTLITGSALDIISRVVQNEINSGSPTEALKAQAVASYTYIMNYIEDGTTPSVGMVSAASVSDKVKEAVKSVLGVAIYDNNHPTDKITAVYSASSAGKTASSASVWGGYRSYLVSKETPFDNGNDPNYGLTVTKSSADMQETVFDATGISLIGDPNDWFKILSYSDGVYVNEMSFGGKTTYVKNGDSKKLTGTFFRSMMGGGSKFKSHSFSIKYDADKDKFTFTTYGYGHGVGMSQNGAKYLAKTEKWNYVQILEFYYSNVTIK